MIQYHGRFNNLLPSNLSSKKTIQSLPTLYDLDIFKANSASDLITNMSHDFLLNEDFVCRYFSPYNFKQLTKRFNNFTSNLSMIHNNLVSLNRNFEYFQTNLLDELDFHFDILGITDTETKIRNSNIEQMHTMLGYKFEYVATPLLFGGVGMFIKDSIEYTVLSLVHTVRR